MKRYFLSLLLFILPAAASPLSAQSGEATSPAITYGNYYCHPKKLKQLRDSLARVEMAGLYLIGDEVHILPAKTGVVSRTEKDRKAGKKMKSVSIKSGGEHIVLVSGLPEYNRNGQPAVPARRTDLPVNGDFDFSFDGIRYRLTHSARTYSDKYPTDIRIVLKNLETGQEQLISERDNMVSTRSYIVFAGDIDGDGRLDLVIDESPKYHQGNLVLLLSSVAGEGLMVGRAASQHSYTDYAPFELMEEGEEREFRWYPQ